MLTSKAHDERQVFRSLSSRGEERGSIIIAMTVILILFLVAVGTLARVLDGLTVSSKTRDFSSALGVAEAGVSDALFRIDQQTGATSSFCIGSDPACALSSVPALAGVQYRAIVPDYPGSSTPDPDEFIIQAEGTVRGIPHAVQVLVQRDLAAQFAAFAITGITLNGRGSNTSITNGPIGSDGSIICNGGGNDGTSQDVFGGGSDNCPVPVHPPGSYNPQPPTQTCPPRGFTFMAPCVPTGSSLQPCPSNNTFSTGLYLTGVYVCSGDVTFSGTVTVAPPVLDGDKDDAVTSTDDGDSDDGMQVFVFPTSSDPSPTVNMSGATINPTQPATDFRLYVAGTAPTINPGTGSAAATVTGLIWAPTGSLTVDGGQMTVTGSLVLANMTINGNPNLTITYDYSLNNLVQQDWQAGDFTEIPVSCFSDSLTAAVPVSANCPAV
jgi:hypothetical protein